MTGLPPRAAGVTATRRGAWPNLDGARLARSTGELAKALAGRSRYGGGGGWRGARRLAAAATEPAASGTRPG